MQPMRTCEAQRGGQTAVRRTLPSYVCPLVVMMTSGARYAGVPTREPGADWNFSCCGRQTHHHQKQRLADREDMRLGMATWESFYGVHRLLWCTRFTFE